MTHVFKGKGAAAVLALLLSGTPLCAVAATVEQGTFGTMPKGEAVKVVTLRNDRGMAVRVLTYGGTLQSIQVPDRDGKVRDIVLGFDNLGQYLKDVAEGHLYFGAMIGRYANRIAYGHFTLDGKAYEIPISLAPHTLHGGTQGFDKRLWSIVSTGQDANGAHLRLGLVSADGDQGFPGTMQVTVDYTLDNDNSLTLRFHATTDKPTVVSLTSHSFWNLDGEGSGSVEDHVIQVNADRFVPTDATGIPTGEIAKVDGTPYDLRQPTRIGEHLRDAHPQIAMDHGYDKSFALNGLAGGKPRPAVTLYSPRSGLRMDVLTTQPALQFYTSNGLDGRYYGKSGKAYRQTDAVALETQAFPDTPNHPQFPTVVLRPGQAYDAETVFHFATQDGNLPARAGG